MISNIWILLIFFKNYLRKKSNILRTKDDLLEEKTIINVIPIVIFIH